MRAEPRVGCGIEKSSCLFVLMVESGRGKWKNGQLDAYVNAELAAGTQGKGWPCWGGGGAVPLRQGRQAVSGHS